jgi:hypothetical protein
MTNEEFNDLEIGDRIKHKIYGISYIVKKISVIDSKNKKIKKITAVKTINIMSPAFYNITCKNEKNRVI